MCENIKIIWQQIKQKFQNKETHDIESKELELLFDAILKYGKTIQNILNDLENKKLLSKKGLEIHLYLLENTQQDKLSTKKFKYKLIKNNRFSDNAAAYKFTQNQHFIYINKNFLVDLFQYTLQENNCAKYKKAYNSFIKHLNISHDFIGNQEEEYFHNLSISIGYKAAKMLVAHELMHIIRNHLELNAQFNDCEKRLVEIDADVHAAAFIIEDLPKMPEEIIAHLFTNILGILLLFDFLATRQEYNFDYYNSFGNYPAAIWRAGIAITFALSRPQSKLNAEYNEYAKLIFMYYLLNFTDDIALDDFDKYINSNECLKEYFSFIEKLVI